MNFIAQHGVRTACDNTVNLLMLWMGETVYATQPLLIRLPAHNGIVFEDTDVSHSEKNVSYLQDMPMVVHDHEQCIVNN